MGVMPGDDGELCAYYLRTSYQKCLFAEQRVKSLTVLVDEYKKKLDRREILDSLLLAMDYDHILVSLRSALENLAKLIGFTISSNLPNALNKASLLSLFGSPIMTAFPPPRFNPAAAFL